MARKTERSDWLTEGLAEERDVFVSGSRTFSSKVDSSGLLTLRVFGHHPLHCSPPTDTEERKKWLPPRYEIPFCMLTCELEEQHEVENFSLKSEEKIRAYITRLLKLPVYFVAYSQKNSFLKENFFVVDPSGQSRAITPQDLAAELNTRRAGRAEDEPEGRKPVNKTLNDYFQKFTRSLLSWQYSINDIDAFVRTPNGIAILELKRSGVDPWLPYPKDVPNYLLMRSLTVKLDYAFDLTVHYDEATEGKLDIHTILNVSRDSIAGFCVPLHDSEAQSAIRKLLSMVKDNNLKPYTSTAAGK